MKGVDNRLVDMAKAFGAQPGRRLWKVVVPQLLPYIMAAARYGLGIIWKITVLVELLGRSSGVGYMLHYWFQLHNMAQLFAWTVFFTLAIGRPRPRQYDDPDVFEVNRMVVGKFFKGIDEE